MNFLQKAKNSLLVLRTTGQHFSTILNSKFSNKKHKKVENMALNRLLKGRCWAVCEIRWQCHLL